MDIANALRNSGYFTGYAGKYQNGYDPVTYGGLSQAVPQGWDRWSVFYDGPNDATTQAAGRSAPNNEGYYAYPLINGPSTDRPANSRAPGTFENRGTNTGTMTAADVSGPTDYSTDVFGQRIRQWLGEAGTRSFFMVFAPYGPHDVNLVNTAQLNEQTNKCTPAARHSEEAMVTGLPNRPVIAGNSFPGRTANRAEPAFNEDVSDKAGSFVGDVYYPVLSDVAGTEADDIGEMNQAHRRRVRCMLSVDDQVGAILSSLEAQGRLANTHVIFTSDNGFNLGGNRLRGPDPTNPSGDGRPGGPLDYYLGAGPVNNVPANGGTKFNPYYYGTAIPLFWRGPGVNGGQVIDKLVGTHDLAVTIAALAGVTLPSNGASALPDGRPLTPLFTGQTTSFWRTGLLIEQGGEDDQGGTGHRADSDQNWDFNGIVQGQNYGATGRFIKFVPGGLEQAYFRNDPLNVQNRRAEMTPGEAESMNSMLDLLNRCSGNTVSNPPAPAPLSCVGLRRPSMGNLCGLANPRL